MANDRYQWDALLSAVKDAGSILLFSHLSPDGDTLGSALALRLKLMEMGKQAWLVMDGNVPDNLAFLPGAGEVLKPDDARVPQSAELALTVDISCRERLGAGEPLFARTQRTALIDHHSTNEGFAQINVIDGSAPATAVLVYRLFKALDAPITNEEAICLYTALATDTGNFIYESTNAECFHMMGALVEAGLPLAEYSRVLFRQKERAYVELLSRVLPSLRVSADGKVAGLRLSLEQMKAAHANNGHTDGIVDYAIDIAGVELAYFVREAEDGRVKGSLRAITPYRVDEVAMRYGGGGHRLAAGCTLDLPLDKAADTLEKALMEALGGREAQ
ncbi:MAG: bifunctional oligoribonuclease/PAP phosphatase NrnA [Clostridia bacterium]